MLIKEFIIIQIYKLYFKESPQVDSRSQYSLCSCMFNFGFIVYFIDYYRWNHNLSISCIFIQYFYRYQDIHLVTPYHRIFLSILRYGIVTFFFHTCNVSCLCWFYHFGTFFNNLQIYNINVYFYHLQYKCLLMFKKQQLGSRQVQTVWFVQHLRRVNKHMFLSCFLQPLMQLLIQMFLFQMDSFLLGFKYNILFRAQLILNTKFHFEGS
eukprot:TRINITY_DN24008_c0_g1_i7.p2 TRINITY_DN24008_c0_g1~~TRINITY_DN24008_c0_g1_i7.p2  ORF type:complete len:209 (+),score=-17.70 TRINITY_DN24008_c0_g1_i7:363-989(+)